MRILDHLAVLHRPTVAVVDLDAVAHNVRSVMPDDAEFMAVVKANGYGHGDVGVARAAVDAGATWLGVALVEEGLRLREAGIDAPILVLTQLPPDSEAEALRAGLTPTLYTDDGLARLARATRSLDAAPRVHVKVDTGMHRVGIAPGRAVGFLSSVAGAGLQLEGLWTHFATSEDLSDDFTDLQLERFRQVVAAAREAGFRPRYLHAANSAATMARPETHFDLVRVGLATYGLSPGPDVAGGEGLRPALTWKSEVSLAKRVEAGEAVSYGQRYRLERPSTIATVPVGYADGYSRSLSNRAHVLIRGRRRPVVGTVTMDMILVDCGDDRVDAGDEVVLIGRQGDAEVTADDLAAVMGTISYEVVCAVSERVPRLYVGGR